MPDLIADAAVDAVARAIAGVQREAERAEQLRAAEHRAFMAEQRETLAEMRRAIEARLLEVKDGADGRDGIDGRDGEPGPQGEAGEQGPQGEQGLPGNDGAPGEKGDAGEPGERGETGEKGDTGSDGPPAYVGEAKGLFDPEAEYCARDVVALNGSAFMAKADNPGECPGDGWMLLAQKGKRGEKGDRGERGMEGKSGKDGAQPIALTIDRESMEFRMILDSGEECAADFYPIAQAIRGE